MTASPTEQELLREDHLSYQHRIDRWMREMFASGGADLRTRMDRLIEEVFELAQAHDYDSGRIAAIRDYVYGRPVGEPAQEMGGVMVTLASFACAADIDMMGEAERELERINTPEVRAKIMAKQASKNGLHTPLPTAEAARTPPSSDRDLAGALKEIVRLTHHEKGHLARSINAVAFRALALPQLPEPKESDRAG